MLKVLVDFGNALASTGIGTYSRSLLASLQDMPDEISASEADVSVPSSSLRPLRRVVYMGRMDLLRRRRFDGADVVHFANSYVPKRESGIAYVTTIYDLDTLLASAAHSSAYVLYYKLILKNLVSRSDKLLTISNSVRNDIVEYFNLDDSRVRLGGIGISPEFARLANKVEKTIPAQPSILFVGTINKKKNIAWLVRTIVRGVRSSAIPEIKLVLAGNKGFGFEEVESELANAGGIVQWIPGLSMQEIVKLYCHCSAVVLPSLREGFGLPLLEAMCCDKPIVASRIPTSIEVANGAADFFSLGNEEEFYEAIKCALSDSNVTQRRMVGRQKLEEHSWKNVSRAHAEVYREAYEETRNRRP